MKLIFISGPSGSGKTTLSKEIIGKIKNGIILSTDNYYKIGLISKLLSKFIEGYFDRSISFNYKLFKKDFNFILKNKISIRERSYDFKKKTMKNFFNEINNIDFKQKKQSNTNLVSKRPIQNATETLDIEPLDEKNFVQDNQKSEKFEIDDPW